MSQALIPPPASHLDRMVVRHTADREPGFPLASTVLAEHDLHCEGAARFCDRESCRVAHDVFAYGMAEDDDS